MSKILIIDDSATILAALAATVRAMKFEPLLAAERPSLVLLDVNMPGRSRSSSSRRASRTRISSAPSSAAQTTTW